MHNQEFDQLDTKMSELTICSSAIPIDKPYIELNWGLITQLNRRDGWVWIVVVDNNEGPFGEKIVEIGDERCLIVEGVECETTGSRRGSYHHAAALNKALGYIHTRFALFLDPDFYIIRREWIDDVIAHMVNNDLGFFGVPWHPKWFTKYRYFPCQHCLFVDLDKVPIQSLDFTPEVHLRVTRLEELKQRVPMNVRLILRPMVRALLQVLTLKDRQKIGSSRDSGYALFRQYGQNSQLGSECAVPVFRLRPASVLWWPNRLAEKLLPDRLCYIPKQPGYYTQIGFRELGYFDVTSRGWEEFMWQGYPFGFHLRRYQQRARDSKTELIALKQAIENLTQK